MSLDVSMVREYRTHCGNVAIVCASVRVTLSLYRKRSCRQQRRVLRTRHWEGIMHRLGGFAALLNLHVSGAFFFFPEYLPQKKSFASSRTGGFERASGFSTGPQRSIQR